MPQTPKVFNNGWDVAFTFVSYHAKVAACVAMYRLYLNFFGGIAFAVKKFQDKKEKEEVNVLKPQEDAENGVEDKIIGEMKND